MSSVGASPARITGLLLAAGQGRRLGTPKSLVEVQGRTLLDYSLTCLLQGGCADVVVVLGAARQEVRQLLCDGDPTWVDRVGTTVCATWAEGMGESLRTGLAALAGRGMHCPTVALVHLVDLPDVTAEVIARVLSQTDGHDTLVRAAYNGVPGHPVLLGQSHWQGVMDAATGDQGGRAYLRTARPTLVECGDLASGRDLDTPADRAEYER